MVSIETIHIDVLLPPDWDEQSRMLSPRRTTDQPSKSIHNGLC